MRTYKYILTLNDGKYELMESQDGFWRSVYLNEAKEGDVLETLKLAMESNDESI